jgi:3-deoxy-manno-octulosonate cytidylyltransferase (CMP-KDO synthetase)
MKTLVVIPARLGATRLPQKPLRLLGGQHLIVRVWQKISDMNLAERCVVATDDEMVASIVRDAGGDCVMTSSSHSTGTERVAEVAAKPEFRAFEAIVNVQGDEPYIGEESIRGAAAMVTSGAFPLGTSAARADAAIFDSAAIVKVVTDNSGRALYFSRGPIPFLRDSADAAKRIPLTLQHIGVYSYQRDALAQWAALPVNPLEEVERLEQLRPLAAGIPIGVAITDEPAATGIDTEDDLVRANEIWQSRFAGASA